MSWRVALVGAWCVAASAQPFGQDLVTPAIPGVVSAGTKVRILQTWDQKAGGDGTVAMADGSVVFSQPAANKIMRITTDGTLSTYLDTTPNQILGLGYDLKGRLLSTHRGEPSGVVALAPAKAVLADRFEGKPFGRPNDLVIDMKGGVYFTDNTGPRPNQPTPVGAANAAVYYITPDGGVELVTELPPMPNGIQLSPDGNVLYVGTGAAQFVMAFDVQRDGRVTNPRNFAQVSEPGVAGGADGFAMDTAGRLYVTANGGVKVFSSKGGQPLGTIPTPKKPTNLAFGGADRKTLFVITPGAMYTIALQSQGVKGRAK